MDRGREDMKLVVMRQEDGQRNWVGAGGGWFALVTSEGENEYQDNIIQSQVFSTAVRVYRKWITETKREKDLFVKSSFNFKRLLKVLKTTNNSMFTILKALFANTFRNYRLLAPSSGLAEHTMQITAVAAGTARQ